MRQQPTDPMAAVCRKMAPFLWVQKSYEWFSGKERCTLDMNSSYSSGGEYILQCRRLFCCSAPWHLSRSQGWQKALCDCVFPWTLLKCGVFLFVCFFFVCLFVFGMSLDPSLSFMVWKQTQDIWLCFGVVKVNNCVLVWFGFHFLQISIPFVFYFIPIFLFYLILPLPVPSICRKILASLLARKLQKSAYTSASLSEKLTLKIPQSSQEKLSEEIY